MSDQLITVDDIQTAHKVAQYVIDNYDDISYEFSCVEDRAAWYRISIDLEDSGALDGYVRDNAEAHDGKVEAVAKALYDSRFPSSDGWDRADRFDKRAFRVHARAALAVIK